MYRFLDRLGPEEIESIAAFVQMQMLEAGFAAVAEFHYVHHQPGGAPYDRLAELSNRIVAAASETGIGLTLLPVLYQHGGCGGQALQPGQLRFGNQPDRFARLHEEAEAAARGGAQAAMRDAGVLSPGRLADLVALDSGAADLNGKKGDTLLDSFIFAGDDRMVTDLWSAGRHVVKDGRHIRHDEIARRYIRVINRLKDAL